MLNFHGKLYVSVNIATSDHGYKEHVAFQPPHKEGKVMWGMHDGLRMHDRKPKRRYRLGAPALRGEYVGHVNEVQMRIWNPRPHTVHGHKDSHPVRFERSTTAN